MKKTKLALELLEQEMELLSLNEQASFIGGSAGLGGIDYSIITDAGGTYVMDNNLYQSLSGEYYYRTSYDGGNTWQNNYSQFQGNLFDSTYIGPDNPEGYNYTPQNMADFFAMVHDMNYDAIGSAGVQGVLVDMDTLKADLVLIANEAGVAGGLYGDDARLRLQGLAVSVGITVGVMIKLVVNGAIASNIYSLQN